MSYTFGTKFILRILLRAMNSLGNNGEEGSQGWKKFYMQFVDFCRLPLNLLAVEQRLSVPAIEYFSFYIYLRVAGVRQSWVPACNGPCVKAGGQLKE